MDIKTDYRVTISPFTQVHAFTVHNDCIVIIFSEAGESVELMFNSSTLNTIDELIQLAQNCKQKLTEPKSQQNHAKLDPNLLESWSPPMQPICSEFLEEK
ncbi:hypothetical protein NG799_28750 [Laspinema sp. D1]|uniref:Uncharacterized protein n=1 Tax=Laspinema palackyanum D2a TaxID=2953684 RepID=A0ABT2N3M9_9CYAN|nr:hypothetical protein [Laspinema sp. D2a]